MIFYDLEDNIPDGKESPELKKRCGADVLISPKGFPPMTDAMIKKHVDAGAILYRVIHAPDVSEGTVDVLLFNLHKMQEFGSNPWQSVLIVLDDHKLRSYEDMVIKIDAWVDHGGTSLSSYGNPSSLYFSKRDKEICAKKTPVDILVPSTVPRTLLTVEKNWTLTLSTFPGVGIKGAKVIRQMIKDRGLGDDLLTALWFLTDWEELQKTKDKNWHFVRTEARKWLGLPDGLNLDIGIREE